MFSCSLLFKESPKKLETYKKNKAITIPLVKKREKCDTKKNTINFKIVISIFPLKTAFNFKK
jgi:hypothetical protein